MKRKLSTTRTKTNRHNSYSFSNSTVPAKDTILLSLDTEAQSSLKNVFLFRDFRDEKFF